MKRAHEAAALIIAVPALVVIAVGWSLRIVGTAIERLGQYLFDLADDSAPRR